MQQTEKRNDHCLLFYSLSFFSFAAFLLNFSSSLALSLFALAFSESNNSRR